MWHIQDKVRHLFYRHGMFCASHPFAIISMVITIAFITCYPLTKVPLPGNAPLMHSTSLNGYKIPPTTASTPNKNSADSTGNKDDQITPRWYSGAPQAYIQQIVIKSLVSPWDANRHIQTDAIRGPLRIVFDITEQINNFQIREGENVYTLSDYCLRVAEIRTKHLIKGLLPEYNCLTVSPANLWKNDRIRFDADGEIMKTIYKKFSPPIHTPPYVKDILFGVSHQDVGISKYYLSNKQRVVSFAVTLVMTEYNPKFVSALREKLYSVYPLSKASQNSTQVDHLVHMYYKDLNYFVEYTPLLVTYAVLFMYIYFSVRKIEMVKSKWGLAFSAVVTVIASLLMSVSICLMFGLTPSLNGSEIFPYLVVIIGLENVLVVTKSVVSTPVYLDVKLRVAQGISKEGWYIFKYMVTELLILAVGFLTFVPAIQEFCAFAVVGLLTDFFLQMFFFTTVLSIDIRRMELSDLQNKSTQQSLNDLSPTGRSRSNTREENLLLSNSKMKHISASSLKTRSPLRVNTSPSSSQQYYTRHSHTTLGSLSGENFTYDPVPFKVPRRVKFLNFWARTRVVQKTMMMCVVIWILFIVYKAGFVALLTQNNATSLFEEGEGKYKAGFVALLTQNNATSLFEEGEANSAAMEKLLSKELEDSSDLNNMNSDMSAGNRAKRLNTVSASQFNRDRHPFKTADGYLDLGVRSAAGGGHSNGKSKGEAYASDLQINKLLLHTSSEPWKKLYFKHWPTLFGYYNTTLDGKYITILPTVHLSVMFNSEAAIEIRHSNDHKLVSKWSKYYNDMAGMYYGNREQLDESVYPQDSSYTGEDASSSDGSRPNMSIGLSVIMRRMSVYPKTTVELILTIVCCGASLIMFIYLMIFLYRCMCPKNYSQWRASWYKSRKGKKGYYKQIRETLPLNLEGHKQEIECITTDGPLVMSTCLGGYIKVWDANSAECLTTIIRSSPPPPPLTRKIPGRNINDSDADLYAEYHGNDQKLASVPSPGLGMSPLEKQDFPLHRQHSVTGLPSPHLHHTSPPSHRKNKHTRFKSADLSQFHFEDIAPDLSCAIDTDFTTLAKEQRDRERAHSVDKNLHLSDMPSVNNRSIVSGSQSIGDRVNYSPTVRGHSRENSNMSDSSFSFNASSFLEDEATQQRNLNSQLSSCRSASSSSVNEQEVQNRSKPQQYQQEKVGRKLSDEIEEHLLLKKQQSDVSFHHQQSTESVLSSSTSSSSISSGASNNHQIHLLPTSATSKEIPIPNQSPVGSSALSYGASPPRASMTSPPSHHHSNVMTSSSPPQWQQQQQQQSSPSGGYNFSKFVEPYYREHADFVTKKKAYMEAKRSRAGSEGPAETERSRSFSFGESPTDSEYMLSAAGSGGLTGDDPGGGDGSRGPPAAVWCLASHQNLIIAGCGNGRIEFWDALTGQMKCHFSNNKVGVTAVCFVGNKITAARLNGTIDFLEIETFVSINKSTVPPSKTTLFNRGHIRQPSNPSLGAGDMKIWDDVIHCTLITTAKAHQRPINLLKSEGGRVVSASQDHTLKVYRLEDSLCLYTLYGHAGSISALHLDRSTPLAAASGAEDGTVRLWDLFTGACVHKLHGHTATVTNLICTPTYVISVGVDDRLCIWERCKGALLHWVQMDPGFCNSVAMLTSNLMVAGGQGCLYLWDVGKGEILRAVQLGDTDHSVFVKQIHVIANAAVVCDYGNQLRVVHFPSVLEKAQ